MTEKQRAAAEQSFAAWAEAKPDLAAKYGLADYVGYVQGKWAEEKDLHRLDRMARQMGRIEENRAASQFVEGAREADDRRAKPPLSLVAGIVGDYLKLCYNPAKDWLRWVAEDLKDRAGARRGAAPRAGGTMHTPRGRALPWKTPTGFGLTHCMGCKAGWTRRGADGAALTVCLLDREPILTEMTDCDRYKEREERPAPRRPDDDPAEPEKISDFLKGRARFRDKGRDR